jgi:hypothetical protein
MKLFERFFGKYKSFQQPEDNFTVTLTNQFVKVEHPERKAEIVYWNDVEEIKLINTDQGPWAPDVWLALLGKESGCLIPQGAKGYDDIFDIVSKYAGFNFENVINSMSCTENEQFLLWKKL